MVSSSVCLRDLIWEGRNQAQHWEEGRLSAGVSTQFTSLASEVNQVFSEFNRRSMSVETLEVLGWRSVDSFAADMLSLA